MSDTPALTPIQQAVAAAQAASAAQAALASSGQTQAIQNQQGGAVATVQGSNVSTAVAGPKFTMEDVSGATMSVDAWFKPKFEGLKIGDHAAVFQGVKVSLNMVDGRGFVIKKGIKGGNPAQYAYTQDGTTCLTGGSWDAACAKMRALEPGKPTAEYRCVDLPFTCVEDFFVEKIVSGKIEKELVIKEGTSIGYTTSTTNWKAWEQFYNAVEKAGLMGSEVLLEVGSEPRTNKNKNEWGTMTFKLIGELAAETASE